MSLDTIKQDALTVLHSTASAIHAQFAALLAQAGHPVSDDDHVETLVRTAIEAGNKDSATVAPNYADHALAAFTTSMTHALLVFAQEHLPAKFQPIVKDAAVDMAAGVVEAVVTCKGAHCTSDGATPHSPECIAEHDATVSQSVATETQAAQSAVNTQGV